MTDSLGLPREKPETVSFEETWPILLKSHFAKYTFHQLSIGGATSDLLLTQANYNKRFNPAIVIIQVGIVDCAPRALKEIELLIIAKLGLLGRVIRYFVKKIAKILRKIRRISYVNETKFVKNIAQINSIFNYSDVFFVGIAPGLKHYEDNLPGVNNKIERYNNIIMNNNPSNYLDLSFFSDKHLMSDGHHLTKEGHFEIFKLLKDKLSGLNK